MYIDYDLQIVEFLHIPSFVFLFFSFLSFFYSLSFFYFFWIKLTINSVVNDDLFIENVESFQGNGPHDFHVQVNVDRYQSGSSGFNADETSASEPFEKDPSGSQGTEFPHFEEKLC
jgi:hypothetical protein